MTLFTAVYVRRSDGKLDIKGKNGLYEKNEPTAKQLDSAPDAKGVSDYYRFTELDEQKHLDWRRKLAGMLMREIGGKEHTLEKAYILSNLPENYRLYEHVKSKATDRDGKPNRNPKNHAGGGHDRQDAYLYGHPLGRKKRFRSPADFFPHLLWLVTDEAGDPNNCTCKLCAPDELQPDPKLSDSSKDSALVLVKKEESKPSAHRNPIVEISSRSAPNTAIRRASSSATPTTASPVPVPVPVPAQSAPSQPITASRLAPPRTADQKIDASYGHFTFRPGELVWYNRQVAWGLAVLLRRWIVPGIPQPENKAYLVQPLSDPFHHESHIVVKSESNMRPWLAWSPPEFCHPALNRIAGLTYENADWQGIRNNVFGQSSDGALTIDASILAAKAIDSSYTLFGRLNTIPASGSTGNETYWNGVYIGAEKLWVGEPVRLRMSTTVAETVLVITSIREQGPLLGQYSSQTSTKIVVTGDLYTCVSVQPPQQPPPQDPSCIPHRMLKDVARRTQASAAFAQTSMSNSQSPSGPAGLNHPQIFYWKLNQPSASLSLADLKGRWYESSIMLPIINGKDSYFTNLRAGKIEGVDRYLNARSECGRMVGERREITMGDRRERREDSWLTACPPGVRVVEGLNIPNIPDEAPQPGLSGGGGSVALDLQDTAMGGVGAQQQEPLDEFMNLDGMEGGFDGGFGVGVSAQEHFF